MAILDNFIDVERARQAAHFNLNPVLGSSEPVIFLELYQALSLRLVGPTPHIVLHCSWSNTRHFLTILFQDDAATKAQKAIYEELGVRDEPKHNMAFVKR